MTNEQLVELIKAGDDGLLPQLWEQVRKLIALKAKRYLALCEEQIACRSSEEDLIQSGYFALLQAVRYYTPDKGYQFTAFLNHTLQNAFREELGIRTSKRDVTLSAVSLEQPIGEENDATLLDTIADLSPGAANVETTIIESIWNQHLRAALDDAMQELTENQRQVITAHYYLGIPFSDLAESRGCSRQNIHNFHAEALRTLRSGRHRKILWEFACGGTVDPGRIEKMKDDLEVEMTYTEQFLA